jgi:protein-tyrosine-phosphatase
MASSQKYDITVHSAMEWAKSELEHVGRIVSMKDHKLQYAYAMSTLNGMAHLKDALFELVNDPDYKTHKKDLLKTHGQVIRTMKHLVKDFKLDLNAIRAFNTGKTLSNLDYLKSGSKTRKNRK